MKYLLVSDRLCRSWCALCCEPLTSPYVRELGTRLTYCCVEHYLSHVQQAIYALTDRSYR